MINPHSCQFQGGANGGSGGGEGSDDNDENQPLDLSWPDTCRERVTYIIFLPLIIPMWLTLPDTRKASGSTVKSLNSNSHQISIFAICS